MRNVLLIVFEREPFKGSAGQDREQLPRPLKQRRLLFAAETFDRPLQDERCRTNAGILTGGVSHICERCLTVGRSLCGGSVAAKCFENARRVVALLDGLKLP